jgi:RNA polymerase sigma factor for flagellar operon FliA
MATHGAPSGESVFLSELATIERVIAFVAGRQHLSAADADDFSSHVKLKLVEDDYAILRKFQGKSSLRTFLTVVIQRLFLDYRIALWGKWRPSAEAKRLGATAILLEQLTTRDGYGFEEACELVTTNHAVRTTRAELEALAARLPSRARRRFESDDVLVSVAAEEAGAESVVAELERQSTANRVGAALARATEDLASQDRLILAMRFEDGRTVAEIASTLRLDQKALYRRIDRLLRDLRSALQREGIESAAVMEMLESPAVSIEWEARKDVETAQAGSSMTRGAHGWR